MNRSVRPLRHWMVNLTAAASIAAAAFFAAPTTRSLAADAPPHGTEVATVEQLKTEAFRALRGGHFDQTNDLLAKAASLSHDPQVERMSAWAKSFEGQREEFAAERQKQYEKAVENVKLLQSKGKEDYAVDATARAYLLSANKKTFRTEGWVDAIVKEAIQRAAADEKSEQWVHALRLYSDLASLEPAQPLWKNRLKASTRRVRLLALYTPDELKHMQESELKEREEVDALLHPATQPTTKPVAEKDENDNFKTDWHETLRGVRMDTLWDALVDAKSNYYRDVSFRDLALGGLNGIEAIVTTKGLEKAFPKLGDDAKKAAFLTAIQDRIAANKDASGATEQLVLRDTLKKLESANRDTVQLPEEVLVSEFADGAFAELDPFTSMIWPTDVEEFRKTTQGEFSGVGIQIQLDEDGALKVVSPLEDSPAYKAGIKAGDIVTRINGKNAKGITLNQAVKNITGEKGTTVTLTVRSPDGVSKDYTIRRETIHVASIKGWLHKPGGGWDWFVDKDNKIAYMRLTNFTQDTSKELDKAIDQIQTAGGRAVILDLRYNPGGLLTAATEVCDKFLGDGVIVSTHPDRDTGNSPFIARAKQDPDDTSLPLIVLTNQYSASASEIVSGCLKDQHRAMVMGERTFGKGSVQMLFPLADRTALLKLTTSHYYLPSGRCIHREENSTEWGVDPDVTIEMTPEQMRAAIDARQDLDVLRDAAPAEGKQPKLRDEALKAEQHANDATTKPANPKKKDLLGSDPQLSAAVLMLRLQGAGAPLVGVAGH